MRPLFLLVVTLFCLPAWAQNPVKIHVTDEANAPVAGAIVETQVWLSGSDPIPSTVTAVDGTTTISVPNTEQGKMVPGRVIVAAKGFAFKGAGLSKETLEIRLEKGATWSGKITDEAGKPLPGARVRISGARTGDDWNRASWISGEKVVALYTAVSGADGNFQIQDVPAKATLLYNVGLPQFAAQNGQNAQVGTEEIIKLKPGGALHGRVLDLEGKPLAKVNLYASPTNRGAGGNDAITDENGFFTAESLLPGSYRVAAYLAKKDYVLPRLNKLDVEAGKTTEAPEMRAVKGVEISGIIRDTATKKPLVGGSIIADQDNESSASGMSDKAGHFSMRVIPGTYRVYLSGSPEGYLRPKTQQNIDASAAVTNLVFDLQKAVKITGTIVDDTDKPVVATLKLGWDAAITSDAAGHFEYTPTDNNPLSLAGGDAEDGYFQVVSPAKIESPTPANVVVKVRKKPWSTLAGRVVGADGAPLAGVALSATFLVPLGNDSYTSGTSTATSAADGTFVIPKIREGRELKIEGKKSDFIFQDGGKIDKDGTNWKSSDLILASLNRRIEGTTAPGAHLIAAGRETTADATGKFAFEALPAGELSVYAAGDGFGSSLVKASEPVTIALHPQPLQGVDSALATEIRAETSRDAVGKRDYFDADLGAAGNFETALQTARATTPDKRDYLILRAAALWKTGDSLELLQNGLEEIVDIELRVAGLLGAAQKTGDADLATNALQAAEQTFKTPEKRYGRESNLYLAAAVTDRFTDQKAGFTALDRAIAYTLKTHGEKSIAQDGRQSSVGRDEALSQQAATIAAGSLPLLHRLLDSIDPDTGYNSMALANAIPVVAKTHGVDAALPLLEDLSKLPKPRQEDGIQYAVSDPQYAFGQAARALIPLLGARSPEEALQLARRVKNQEHSARALASAAKFQTGDAAANLWREVMDKASTDDSPRFAAAAWRIDPKLGLELFKIARAKVATEMSSQYVYRNMWATFAFYYAPVDAAESRLILEREWALSLQKRTDSNSQQSIARAMSVIDGRRAWEMAKQIKGDDNAEYWSLDTRRKIAQYLNTSEEKRRDLPFDRWGASDNWEPGEAEW